MTRGRFTRLPMHVALRVLPAAFGAIVATWTVDAQPEARPPIFALESEQPRPPPRQLSPSLLSERSRALVASASNRWLADTKTFDASSAGTRAVEPPITTDGITVQMSPYVVKSTIPPRVQAPELPLYHFSTISPDDPFDRRMIGGVSATLFRFDERREFIMNIIHAAGSGIDHTRVELAFKLRF